MVRIKEIFDSEADAIAFRERYYRNYHPLGYGTNIDISQLPDGKWEARGYRGDSAD